MGKVRIGTLTALLVVALALSACSTVLPGATTSLNNLGSTLSTLLPRAQTAAASAASANTAPQAAAAAVTVGDLQAALEQVYAAVNPSVVNIRVVMQAETGTIQGTPNRQFPFGQGTPDQNTTPQATAEGSGFVWDKQGHIVTNNHVVDGATEITVTFSDGTSLPAEKVGSDADSDLAVIKVDPAKIALQPVAVADSTQVKPGQLVVAIGNPFGLEGSMSFGIVSAVGRSLPTSSGTSDGTGRMASYTIPDVIQTDAPVNPGNSGGVLLDLAGNLIGVPTAIESSVNSSAGVGFAVPSVVVQKVVPELIEKGVFVHPYIGISGGSLTSQVAQAMDLPETQRGALVVSVTAGSPAEKAGLRGSAKQAEINGEQVQVGGDVITAIGGQPVKDFEDLTAYLARWGKVGQRVELSILRDGKTETLALTLAARPGSKTAAATSKGGESQATAGNAWLGVNGTDLTAEFAEAMDLDRNQTGALIATVTRGSPADKAGLRGSFMAYQTQAGEEVMIGGDVVTAVDGKAVETMSDLATAIQAHMSGDQVELTVLRDGKALKVEVTLAARSATSN